MSIVRSIPAGQFKARCLALLDEVASTGEQLVITKRGKPVARLVPATDVEPADLTGSVEWVGDIESPIDVDWDALR